MTLAPEILKKMKDDFVELEWGKPEVSSRQWIEGCPLNNDEINLLFLFGQNGGSWVPQLELENRKDVPLSSTELADRLMSLNQKGIIIPLYPRAVAKSQCWSITASGQICAYLLAYCTHLEDFRVKLSRCLLPLKMSLVQADLVDEPIKDESVVLAFVGSGASDSVTAGMLRDAFEWSLVDEDGEHLAEETEQLATNDEQSGVGGTGETGGGSSGTG